MQATTHSSQSPEHAVTARAPLSSAQTISMDILYHIFKFSLSKITLVREDGTLLSIDRIEPMNFSMVCSSWRAVVLSHPSLWSRIHLLHYESDFIPPLFLHIHSKWLDYSRNALLDVALDLSFDGTRDEVDSQHLLDTTFAQNFRIKNLEVTMYDLSKEDQISIPFSPSFVSVYLDVMSGQNPQLTHLASVDLTSYFASNELEKVQMFGRIRWILPKAPDRRLHFPKLSHLMISTNITGDLDDIHTIFSACPNIETLSVTSLHSSSTSRAPSTRDPVLLLHLTSFIIDNENRSTTLQLLKWIASPSLRSFKVDRPLHREDPDEHGMNPALLIACKEFIARSRPPLTELSLSGSCPPLWTDSSSLPLRELLRPLSTLTSLSLQEVAVDDDFFEELTFRNGDDGQGNTISQGICPLLSKLLIRFHDFQPFRLTPKTVKTMIESRRVPLGKSMEFGLMLRTPRVEELS
ncbi:hypothetical protein SCHPADRAFT_538233 [Schizopora paradoxa]|uniref:F-box domain-containing protein n=1 Tax=Schizopora paradoxa TaxID=27342 RepID=A0A0H2RKP3_9AGAM|nr:hypothetical protein SCHPADRAFT_538233 [Schizopora paradoxa]